ncbi:hypothetical protein OM076_37580 [Solirubrobacter ginsenosidimutans]|uniref:Uncharacterized protein n=1 Tax=Solirubrobacter ginsenosidimutans TaxID=490573 RepID=A0A9X3S5W8_9ACTN|nr:hypothetical protein [Solirubrobacter ginsenosidimutans]MDA0166037.1 hypothetical protein [Solirubrobacter ginsenosidimutans]
MRRAESYVVDRIVAETRANPPALLKLPPEHSAAELARALPELTGA